MLVFGNYHEAASDAKLHEVLRTALQAVPSGHRLIVISRHAPPPALMDHAALELDKDAQA